MNQNRIYWIDAAKFLGIAWIAVGHAYSILPLYLVHYAYSFHLALFWCLSGICLNENNGNYNDVFRKSFKRYLIPYYFFNVLIYFYICLLSKFRAPDPFIFFKNTFYLLENWMTTPLWFLPALAVISNIFFLVKKINLLKKFTFFMVIMYLIINAYSIEFKKIISIDAYYYFLCSLIYGFIFYSFGYFFKKQIIAFNPKKKMVFWGLMIQIALFIILKYYYIFDLIMGMSNIIQGFIGVLVWISISKLLKYNKWIDFYGKNTLLILALHEPIFVFYEYLNKFLIKHWGIIDVFVTRKEDIFLELFLEDYYYF